MNTGARYPEKTYDWHRAMRGELRPMELAFVLVLSTHMNPDGTLPARFTPSLDTLVAEMGLAPSSRKTVIGLVKSLEQKGFLEVTRAPRGHKKVNRYRALLPVGTDAVVVDEPPAASVDGVDQPAGSGSTTTLPTPPDQEPPTRDHSTAHGTDKEIANALMRRTLALLPEAEAEAIWTGLARSKHSGQLGRMIAQVVRAGRGEDLVRELTAVRIAGHQSPYQGSRMPHSVLWGRVRELHAEVCPR